MPQRNEHLTKLHCRYVAKMGIRRESCSPYAQMAMPNHKIIIREQILLSKTKIMYKNMSTVVPMLFLTRCIVKPQAWILHEKNH